MKKIAVTRLLTPARRFSLYFLTLSFLPLLSVDFIFNSSDFQDSALSIRLSQKGVLL